MTLSLVGLVNDLTTSALFSNRLPKSGTERDVRQFDRLVRSERKTPEDRRKQNSIVMRHQERPAIQQALGIARDDAKRKLPYNPDRIKNVRRDESDYNQREFAKYVSEQRSNQRSKGRIPK